jgi:hypothetical protein
MPLTLEIVIEAVVRTTAAFREKAVPGGGAPVDEASRPPVASGIIERGGASSRALGREATAADVSSRAAHRASVWTAVVLKSAIPAGLAVRLRLAVRAERSGWVLRCTPALSFRNQTCSSGSY